jgi:DNA-binding FadR family transcriptional regulator
MTPPIRRNPLVDQVAKRLFAEVSAGSWSVGQRLPSETVLAGQYGVGRSTIREAIRSLAGSGMLESRQGSGVYVVSLQPVDDIESRLRHAGLLEVYEVRRCLEVEAARLAALRRTESDLELIGAALERRRASARAESAQELVAADLGLHQAVVAAAGNSALAQVYAMFMPLLRPHLVALAQDDVLNADDRLSEATDAHDVLVDAIRRGAPEVAVAATLEYLGGVEERLRAAAAAAGR